MKKTLLLIGILIAVSLSYAQEVKRKPLFEIFTSSTCPPCRPGNTVLHNALGDFDNSWIMIKYQMNWPDPGDPYYTAEGYVKRGLYTVSSVPYARVDGTNEFSPSSISVSALQQYLQQYQSNLSSVVLVGDMSLRGQSVDASVTINPKADITGNLKLFMAAVELRTVNNKKTNGETEFHYVMKKFLPDANGITLDNLVANRVVTIEQTYSFQGSYRLPSNASNPINHTIEHSVEDFDNLVLVAWIQNMSTKEVLQACTGIPGKHEVNFNITGGTVIAVNNETTDMVMIDSDVILNEGDEVSFYAAPDNADQRYVRWVINGETIDNVEDVYKFTLDKATTIDISFSSLNIPITKLTNVTVYPNPINDVLTISNAADVQTVLVSNVIGQIVKEVTLSGADITTINMDGLNSGIYLITLKAVNGEKIVKKVIKE